MSLLLFSCAQDLINQEESSEQDLLSNVGDDPYLQLLATEMQRETTDVTNLQKQIDDINKREIQSGEMFFNAPDGPTPSLGGYVEFPHPFSYSTPTVVVSLLGIDSGGTNTKMGLTLTSVDNTKFYIQGNAWEGSHFYSFKISYIAYTGW